MPGFDIVLSAVANGLLTGGIYALVALGLTLIYGVLHIVNFAHGALLMTALFVAWVLAARLGVDPYLAIFLVGPLMFGVGWGLYRFVIEPCSGNDDRRLLLATLAVAIVLENAAQMIFAGDTRSIETPYSFSTLDFAGVALPVAKLVSFCFALLLALVLWAFIALTRTGRAVRAVAREIDGARLVGIRPERIYRLAYAIGTACLGAAACLMLPSFYVNPQVGHVFVLVAFTIVVVGGMGSFMGALLGGLLIGTVESLGGLFLGESLGPVLVPVVFLTVLLFRPQGILGAAR